MLQDLAHQPPELGGRDPMGVFPRPSSAADVPVTFRETSDASGGGNAGGTPAPKPAFDISVYLDDGRVYTYEVTSMASAREHSAAIVAGGYRSVQEDQPNVLTHYPPHRIVKVKVTGKNGASIPTSYYDRASGT
jgi:hypothetical protein